MKTLIFLIIPERYYDFNFDFSPWVKVINPYITLKYKRN